MYTLARSYSLCTTAACCSPSKVRGTIINQRTWLWSLRYSKLLRFFAQQAITSMPKVRVRKDKPLDAVVDEEKVLVPVIKIRDAILKFQADAIPLRFLIIRRRALGFKMANCKFVNFINDYPTMFEVFTHPQEKLPWCRLTPQVTCLLREEAKIYEQEEPMIVYRLRKLLMLSRDRRISVHRLTLARSFFGFPDDFDRTIVPKYPQYFQIVQSGKPGRLLELAEWDESLANTEFEKKAKMDAKSLGLGDIETRRKPLAFKTQYSPSMKLKKRVIYAMEMWQRHPYVCPYQRVEEDEDGSPLAERRMIALIHEILGLTIEKRISTEVLRYFNKDFNLPFNVCKVVNKLPGMFYVSVKGAVHTLFLREAYKRQQIVEEHPLLCLKAKYHKLLKAGPQLRTTLCKSNRQGLHASSLLEYHQRIA